MKHYKFRFRTLIAAFIIISSFAVTVSTGLFSINTSAENSTFIFARPLKTGQLKVTGTQLTDMDQNPVMLMGLSLHGITWFDDFVNEDLFRQISTDLDVNLIRIPVYSKEYEKDPEESYALAKLAIEYAIKADMYAIIDWHILEDNDPNEYKEYAIEFFDRISSEYAGCPNLIYEICNEPNGDTKWADISNYANETIPHIRNNSPDSVILVGTPDYSRDLFAAARNPLQFDNIMYTLHFYAASHKVELRNVYLSARERGLPIFVSECGLSEASGTGDLDFESASSWFSLLEDNCTSFVVWSLSNKNETSALLRPAYTPSRPFSENNLSRAGKWVRFLLRGDDPRSIEIPESDPGYSVISYFIAGMFETENIDVAYAWPVIAPFTLLFVIICSIIILIATIRRSRHYKTYDDIYSKEDNDPSRGRAKKLLQHTVIFVSVFFTMMYIIWRVLYSIPYKSGAVAITGNLILLAVEVFGFLESLILYRNLIGLKDHPLPKIDDEEYPDVDIFIATYNEPCDLLRKTVNGCNHLKYPDKSRVHIWLCDDNRRSAVKELADMMHVGYFDRPDNKGAKAGNLNHALRNTTSPYVVTFDADMIPRSDFLLKTIPYFIEANKRSENLPEDKKIRLGLLQTPQCFYTPDVFQYALYSEKTAPNEQDFFYRTIEAAKTSSNSVIYGGSNTVISREALDAVGGFYEGSITEDFATGMNIEAAGFVSLATPEPLASGMTPHTYKEHIRQRERWGRGVISTGKQLRLIRRKGLSFIQKLSYLSSVVYWYSPVKNLVYILSPLFFAVFAIPVFKCGWLDLLIYWLPMFIMQDVALRVFSGNAVSLKWSGIYETSVMPHLLVPILKETFGISASVFEVTDKSKKKTTRKKDKRSMIPFFILIALSIFGIIRSIYILTVIKAMGIIVLLFWLIRNMYFLVMSVFLIDGRDGGSDDVTVIDAEPVNFTMENDSDNRICEGITTFMTSHSLKVYMDDSEGYRIGDKIVLNLYSGSESVTLKCLTTSINYSRHTESCVLCLEIMNLPDIMDEYNEILYDRIPTLPQSLTRDYGIITHMLRNIAHRILR